MQMLFKEIKTLLAFCWVVADGETLQARWKRSYDMKILLNFNLFALLMPVWKLVVKQIADRVLSQKSESQNISDQFPKSNFSKN